MNNKLCTLYLIRHGETEWNAIDRMQGHAESNLNETGKNQAAEARSRFKDVHFVAIFSSDLLRTRQTA